MASNTVGKYCVTYDKRKLKDAFLKYLTQKDRCDNTPITVRICFKVYTVTYESDQASKHFCSEVGFIYQKL